MKIAIAQIDARLGDIDGICSCIERQAVLAREQGADLLCTPSPLFSGLMPGALVESANYEHDLLSAFDELSARLAALDIAALVPASVSIEGVAVFETFLLKEGEVTPLRGVAARRRAITGGEVWAPPVFDFKGVRLAVSFDAERDIHDLPAGCDMLVSFESVPFNRGYEASSGIASIADGYFQKSVSDKGVWLACVFPVGAFDEAVFCGGSFIMDDSGRVLAAARCFEEDLIVQEVRRGIQNPCIEAHELPQFDKDRWLLEALRIYVRDAASARGMRRAALILKGDLPSSLMAAIAVDALGPRNVIGLVVENGSVCTPEEESGEARRISRVRELARNLGIRLIERSAVDASLLMDEDMPAQDRLGIADRIEGLYLEDVAYRERALPVSSITKTDAAVAAPAMQGAYLGAVAPLGDVYLSETEFLASIRAISSPTIPSSLVRLDEVRRCLARTIDLAVAGMRRGRTYAGRVKKALSKLDPAEFDGVLEAHVDRGLSFDDIPVSQSRSKAVAVILMLVRSGEAPRRMLPPAPAVSGRSFAERMWPEDLAWSDTGRLDEDRRSCEKILDEELERFIARAREHGNRVRGEAASIIAASLGIPPEVLQSIDLEAELRKHLAQLESDAGDDGPQSGQLPPFGPGFTPPDQASPGQFFSVN